MFLTKFRDIGSPRQILELISKSKVPVYDGLSESETVMDDEGRPNQAQNTAMASISHKNGGIDLTSSNMYLETQNSGGLIKFHMDAAMLERWKDAHGIIPVVTSIQRLRDLKGFLTSVS